MLEHVPFALRPLIPGLLTACALVSVIPAASGVMIGVPVQVGTNTSPSLPEISGLVASRANFNTLWVHNDRGDTARFFAMSTQGDLLGTFPLDGATAIDWEDIAIGPKPGGGNYLYLGDVGDNDENHPAVSIYRLDEPLSTASATIPSAQYSRAVLQYQEGPRDAEALFVDPLTSDAYIITKSSMPMIYRVDASAFDAAPQVTTVPVAGNLGAPLFEPTAADISPDGRHILVRGKSSTGYLFERTAGQSVLDALAGPGIPVALAVELQGEAIGWAADGRGFYTTSERKGASAPIYYYSFSAPEPASWLLAAIGMAALAARRRGR